MLAVDPRCRNDSVYQKTLRHQRFLLRRRATAARRSATCSCSARSPAPILKANAAGARAPLLPGSPRKRRLVPDERGPARPGEPGHGRRRAHRARLAPLQHDAPHRGWSPACASCFKAAGYPIVLARRLRPPHAVAPVRHGALRHRSRDRALDPFCRAHDHPNCTWSTPSFLPTSAAVNPALDHRRAGAARGGPSDPRRRTLRRGGPCLTGPSPSSPARGAASAAPSPKRWPRAGFDIAITDLAEDEADEAAAPPSRRARRRGRCTSAPTSPTSTAHAATVDAVVDRFGRIDCLVNNAGIGSTVRGDLLDLCRRISTGSWASICAARVFLTQAVARWMLATGSDRPRSIVPVTSVSAELASPERARLLHLQGRARRCGCKALALRLAPEGIAVFEVRPGHHPHRHDRRRRRHATTRTIADGLVPARRWGERRTSPRVGRCARARRLRLRHGQRDRRRWRARRSARL